MDTLISLSDLILMVTSIGYVNEMRFVLCSSRITGHGAHSKNLNGSVIDERANETDGIDRKDCYDRFRQTIDSIGNVIRMRYDRSNRFQVSSKVRNKKLHAQNIFFLFISLVDEGVTVISFHEELRLRSGLLRWIPCNILVLSQLFTVSLWSNLLCVTPPIERSPEFVLVKSAVYRLITSFFA